MELRNGKKYFLITNQKKKTMPKYVKKIMDYIKQDFARAGLEIIQTNYEVVKCQSRPRR